MSEPKRCGWAALGLELMLRYHDEEWGEPMHDEGRHFEMLVLEGAQAGLSWTTILNKRENYRRAFDGFDYEKVARYTRRDVERLLGDAGIVRNKLKVASAISNAQAFIAVREEFGSFDEYIWGFVGGKPKVNSFRSYEELPASTAESGAMSKDLKKRGFRFVGTTICYAYMQSAGMVDDHEVACFRHGR